MAERTSTRGLPTAGVPLARRSAPLCGAAAKCGLRWAGVHQACTLFSFFFSTNLASLEESDETRAAAPSSRPSTGLQLWSQLAIWQQPPQRRTPDLRLLQSDRRPPPGWEVRDSRSCDPQGEPQAVGLPGAGLRIRVQGEAGPSANTALVGPPPCAPSPPVHLSTLRGRAPLRQPPHLRTTSTSLRSVSFLPLRRLATVLSQTPTLGLRGEGLAPNGPSTAWRLRPGRLSFVGRGLPAQETVKTAQLPKRRV